MEDGGVAGLLQYDLPLWVTIAVSALTHLGKFIGWVRRLRPVLGKVNERLKHALRQWLEVKRTVVLTQKAYDDLPVKDDDTLYMTAETHPEQD